METTLISYREGGSAFDAYLAYPARASKSPAVLVCHAWGGRDAFAEAKAQALAELGYVGAAIDVYGVGKRGGDKAANQALMTPLLDEPATLGARLRAAYETVRGADRVDASRMGAIGFCFGGLCSILMARMGLELSGVVSFHGLLKTPEPLQEVVRARILVLHGQDDPMVPPDDIGRFASEMQRVKADWKFHAYPGAMHAFTNPAANDPDFGTVYQADADRRSWAEMRQFFEECFG